MNQFWKVIIIIVLVLAAMVLITYTVPGIKEFAVKTAADKKLPLWVVGLFAPIVYLFKRLGEMLSNLVGSSPTEDNIRAKNEEIKAKLDGLEKDVRRLDDWRQNEVEKKLQEVARLNQQLSGMQGRAGQLDRQVDALEAERAGLRNAIRDDPGTIE
jgi:flagellar motility protein MotE (MotC chaperone)